jgi:hypothetical protein
MGRLLFTKCLPFSGGRIVFQHILCTFNVHVRTNRCERVLALMFSPTEQDRNGAGLRV